MLFEWDEVKNRMNKNKHGLSFETASFIFQDPFILSVPDNRHYYTEERWQSLGLLQEIAVLIYVAHTVEEEDYGEEIIRIISARAATSGEARRYYVNRKNVERS